MANESSLEKLENVFAEVKTSLTLAVPLVTVDLGVFLTGHLCHVCWPSRGANLSGASLATLFVSVTGFSLLTGMAGALETICGQSYGVKQYHVLGIHMQKAKFTLLVVSIPLACMRLNKSYSSILWTGSRDINCSRTL